MITSEDEKDSKLLKTSKVGLAARSFGQLSVYAYKLTQATPGSKLSQIFEMVKSRSVPRRK